MDGPMNMKPFFYQKNAQVTRCQMAEFSDALNKSHGHFMQLTDGLVGEAQIECIDARGTEHATLLCGQSFHRG